MKCFIVISFVLVIVLASSYATPAKGSTKASLKKKTCVKDCGSDYKPVCAGDGANPKENKSFGSECVLSNYNCENGKNLQIVSQGECPGGGGVRLA